MLKSELPAVVKLLVTPEGEVAKRLYSFLFTRFNGRHHFRKEETSAQLTKQAKLQQLEMSYA